MHLHPAHPRTCTLLPLSAGNTCFINAALQCLRYTPGLPLQVIPNLLEQAELARQHSLGSSSGSGSGAPGLLRSASSSGAAMFARTASGSVPQAGGPSSMGPSQGALHAAGDAKGGSGKDGDGDGDAAAGAVDVHSQALARVSKDMSAAHRGLPPLAGEGSPASSAASPAAGAPPAAAAAVEEEEGEEDEEGAGPSSSVEGAAGAEAAPAAAEAAGGDAEEAGGDAPGAAADANADADAGSGAAADAAGPPAAVDTAQQEAGVGPQGGAAAQQEQQEEEGQQEEGQQQEGQQEEEGQQQQPAPAAAPSSSASQRPPKGALLDAFAEVVRDLYLPPPGSGSAACAAPLLQTLRAFPIAGESRAAACPSSPIFYPTRCALCLPLPRPV